MEEIDRPAETPLDSRLRYWTQWSLLTVLAISILSFAGWVLGSTIITSFSNDYQPIAPSTACCFFILSASLLGYAFHPEGRYRRLIALLSASFVISICFILLIAFFQGITLELEHLGFYHSTATLNKFPTGHMSPLTAGGFIVASLGVLLCLAGGRSYKNVAALLSLALVFTALVVLLGYLYGTPLLYGGTMIPVAFPTAVAFVFLGLGMLTTSGSRALPVRVFSGPSVRSRLLRAFLPTIIVFVLIYGWAYKTILPMTGNPALISSLITILSAAVIGIIIFKMAHSLGAEMDLARSELDKQTEALRESEVKFRSLAEQSLVGISIIQDGAFKYVNPKFADMFAYTVAECLDNMPYQQIVFSEDWELVREQAEKRLAGEGSATVYEFRGVTKEGKIIDIEIYGAPILYNKKPAALGTLLDISHRKLVERELKALSMTDTLTGLYNRRGFMTLAEQQLKQVERSENGFLLLFADLDHLKDINDNLGHKIGDEAIAEAAEVFREVFRKMDIIARMGGDEFAVLAPDVPREYSGFVARRLQDQLAVHNGRANRDYAIYLSAGMVYCDPAQPRSLDELLSKADSLMYEQKRAKQ